MTGLGPLHEGHQGLPWRSASFISTEKVTKTHVRGRTQVYTAETAGGFLSL